jgi:integrase
VGAYKDRGHWRYQKKNVMHWDGVRRTVRGTPAINTKAAALAEERAHLERVAKPPRVTVPTLDEWFRGTPTETGEFTGRFWTEWVVARMNKPTERNSKRKVYLKHLRPVFGHLPLDRIGVAEIARFRAALVESGLKRKTINKILCVLSKPLNYAADCDIISKAPKVGLFKNERKEIVSWGYEEYARLLVSAQAEGCEWHVAVALAGEAGLRVGEVKALRWREDVDMIARTITVNQQTCEGVTTTPKGGTRRTIPMTSTLYEALKCLPMVRDGLVLRNADGSAKPDGETDHAIARICRRAGLPVRYWHTLRHTFGTHAALFGVNPWRLQAWLGHKRIDETMLYVHVAENHARELPDPIRDAAVVVPDPDTRIVTMLGARATVPTNPLAVPAHVPMKRRSRALGSPGAHEHSADSAASEQAGDSPRVSLSLVGSGGGFRTPDPAVNSRLLYH